MLALYTIRVVGRRTKYILGQFFLAFFLFVMGWFVLEGWNLSSFIALCFFFVSNAMSQAVVNWLYISEVTVDAASGFCIAGKAFNMMIVAFTFEFMINSPL